MKSLIETIYYAYFEPQLLEMANYSSKSTGLSHHIYISSKHTMSGSINKHGPRIKVSNVSGKYAHDDNFVVTVHHEPKVIGNCKLKPHEIDDIKDWVKLNHDHLRHVWEHGDEMDSNDVNLGFKKL